MKISDERAQKIRRLAKDNWALEPREALDLLDDREELLFKLADKEGQIAYAIDRELELKQRIEKLERVVARAREINSTFRPELDDALRTLDRSEALDEIGRIGEKQRALDEEEA